MDNRKKIIILVKGLGQGGVEQLLVTSIPYLNREEFSYEIVYMLPWKDKLTAPFSTNGIPVTCLNVRNLADIRIIPRIVSYLKQQKPDLLEIHLPYPGIVGRIAGKIARIHPIVYVEHSLAVQKNLIRMHVLTFLGNIITYPLNDFIVTVSEDTHRDVRRHCSKKMPTQVVYNGIDLTKIEDTRSDIQSTRQFYKIPDNHLIVGHVANLLPKKRQEDLLKAAKKVISVFPNVTFMIVGRGPLEQKLKQTVRELSIENNVIFTGFVENVYDVMRMFDIFVMSSKYEGFGISLAEAMAMGKPAVAPRVGGIPEVIEDKVSGFLVNPSSPDDLADKILNLLKDNTLRRTMGESARMQIREKFDIRNRVAEMEDIYRKLLNSPAR